MSKQNDNNEIVRYQNTESSYASVTKEDKRLIDMMYAFDDDLNRSLAKPITENDSKVINDIYDDYFPEKEQKPTIFKKKIVIDKRSDSEKKFDLNKFKIPFNPQSPSKANEVAYSKVIINNVNNNNNNNIIITTKNNDSVLSDDEDPLSTSIINSIKPRFDEYANELQSETHNIMDFNKSSYTKSILRNEPKKAYASCSVLKIDSPVTKPKRRKSTDLPLKRILKSECDLKLEEEDIEMSYLNKLSKLKGENEKYIQEIKSLKEQIEIKNTNEINNKSKIESLNFEYEILEKKYNDLKVKFMSKENEEKDINDVKCELKKKEEKCNEYMNQIEKLQNEINELKNVYNENKCALREAKTNYESIKNQYDLLLLKSQTLTDENFALKRELLLYTEKHTTPSCKERCENNNEKNETKNILMQFKTKSQKIENTQNETNGITHSRRRQIVNNQNDSSGVSSLLSFTNEPRIEQKKIEKHKSFCEINKNDLIEKESEVIQLEKELLSYQQQKNKFEDELNKFPEYPKQKSVLISKRNVQNEIDILNTKINTLRTQLREIKRNFY